MFVEGQGIRFGGTWAGKSGRQVCVDRLLVKAVFMDEIIRAAFGNHYRLFEFALTVACQTRTTQKGKSGGKCGSVPERSDRTEFVERHGV